MRKPPLHIAALYRQVQRLSMDLSLVPSGSGVRTMGLPMSSTELTLRVFIASPGGLQPERKTFRNVIEEFNQADALQRGLHFTAVGWEDTLESEGRPQALINEDLKKCDYGVFVVCDRWGSSPTRTKSRFRSGFEEEFAIAEQTLSDPDLPMSQIIILFKGVAVAQLADPGVQLRRVLRFRRRIEKEKRHLYHHFDDMDEFSRLLRRFLSKWTRDQEQDDHETPESTHTTTPNPSDLDTEIALATDLASSRSPEALARYGAYLETVERYSLGNEAAVLAKRLLREQEQKESALANEIRAVRTLIFSDDEEPALPTIGENALHIHLFLAPLGASLGNRGPNFNASVSLGDEYSDLGSRLVSAGLLSLAQEVQVRALAWARSERAKPQTISRCLHDLAVTNCLCGRHKVAEALARSAISTITERPIDYNVSKFTPHSGHEAAILHTLAVVAACRRDHALARDLFDTAQLFWGEIYGHGVGLYRPVSARQLDVESASQGDNSWAESHAGIGVNYLLEGELALAEKFHIEVSTTRRLLRACCTRDCTQFGSHISPHRAVEGG